MKILSSALTSALNSQEPIYTKKFLLYTRTWQAGTQTYTFAAAQDITKYILETSKIKWKLDNEGYSVWNNAVLNITLSNINNYFSQNNFFWGGAKIEVFISAKTANNTDNEEIKIFRGFVLNSPLYDQENRTLSLSLNGELALLETYSAGELTQSSTLEILTPAQEDPSKTFYTQNNAVCEISAIYQGATADGAENATLLKAFNDYKISGLEQYNTPAQIALNVALPATDSLWCSYRYYYTDKTCEWLASKIADICGATSRQIDPVFYSSTIEASYTCPAYNDFTEGTLTDLEINNNTLQLEDNFLTDTDYTWTVLSTPSNATVTTAPSSILVIGPALSGQAVVRAPTTQAYGTWEAEVSVAALDEACQFNYFISSADSLAVTNGYCLSFDYYDNYVFFDLYRLDNGQRTLLNEYHYPFNYISERLRYRITRAQDGTFKIWVKSIYPTESAWYAAIGTTTQDNTYTTSAYQFFQMVGYGGNNVYNYQTSPLTASGSGSLKPYGNYLSPVIRGGNTFRNWGNFEYQQSLNNGSATFYIRFKNDYDITWSAWEIVTNNQSITSTKNCAQIKWQVQSNTEQTQSPVLNSFRLTWEITGVNIATISTKNMSCLQVMKELAALSGYQIGFDSQGKFLFLNRALNESACLTLTAQDIISLESLNLGTNKLYTSVKVKFGDFDYQITPFTLGETRPNIIDKYGIKEFTLSSAFLPAQNANLARAAAPDIYARACKEKQRAALICKFLPQIELGDILEVNYPPFLSLTMQAEGLELDLNTWQMRLDLTEI